MRLAQNTASAGRTLWVKATGRCGCRSSRWGAVGAAPLSWRPCSMCSVAQRSPVASAAPLEGRYPRPSAPATFSASEDGSLRRPMVVWRVREIGGANVLSTSHRELSRFFPNSSTFRYPNSGQNDHRACGGARPSCSGEACRAASLLRSAVGLDRTEDGQGQSEDRGSTPHCRRCCRACVIFIAQCV